MICDRLPKCICKFKHIQCMSISHSYSLMIKATGYAMESSQLFDSSDLAAILYSIIFKFRVDVF